MIQVYPAINETTVSGFENKLQIAEQISPVIHVDIADGKFITRKTISLQSLVGKSDHRFIVHYMGVDPLQKIEQLPENTWQYVFHYEAVGDTFYDILKECKRRKIKPVLALSPETNVSAVKELIHSLDYVHVMTVNPGKSKQKMLPRCLRKVKLILNHNPNAKISIDGGVNLQTAKMVRLYPIHSVAASSAIIGTKDPKKALQRLKKELN